jgi:hypothetical protein
MSLIFLDEFIALHEYLMSSLHSFIDLSGKKSENIDL